MRDTAAANATTSPGTRSSGSRVRFANRNLIYIGGYGRSGSTLLEILLSDHGEFVGCGEVRVFPHHALEGRLNCSCGSTFSECSVWSHVFAAKGHDKMDAVLRQIDQICWESEGWRGLLVLAFLGRRSKFFEPYRRCVTRFYENLFRGLDSKTLIESSKTARSARFRPAMLYRVCGIDVRLIHLTRDPRGILFSITQRGSNENIQRGDHHHEQRFVFLRVLVGWSLANVSCLVNRFCLGNDRYLRVRYEDLVTNPEQQFQRIGRFLKVNYSETCQRIKRNECFEPTHTAGGNRLARSGTVQIRPDNAWKRAMPRWQAVVVWLLQLPLVVWMGYRLLPDGSTRS